MKIGKLEIKGNVFLAPMCNVTSLPFRLLCKKYGAAMMYSEMIHADAYVMESEKSSKRAYYLEEERPIGIQLTGSNIDVLEQAIKKIEKKQHPDLIDINIGCPAHNVIKSGAGSALLKDIDKLSHLIKKLSSAINIPLTCKIRILTEDKETIKTAQAIEKAGAKAITVHGRTVKQKYSGKADWNIIKKVKDNLSIPIILNGDVKDEESAKRAFETTGCDAVMIGRAAIGNPHIFKRINHYLETGERLPKQSIKDKVKEFSQFLGLCRKYGYMDMLFIKTEAANFAKNFEGAAKIRAAVSKCITPEDIEKILRSL
jgi:tRNA-dihydrouridine synthase B